MGSTSRIIYQPYIAGARGALKAGPPLTCPTLDDGMRRAERALAAGSILGARIVRVTHDDDAEEFAEPDYLAALGQVPEPE